jgi:aminodeoxyfutalosine synthase
VGENHEGLEGVTSLQAHAERVSQGSLLSLEDAGAVLASHDLIAIGMMADEVRRRMHGADATFLRVFEMHLDAIPSTLPANVAAGEFRIVGIPGSLDVATSAVTAARRLAGDAVLTGFSLADLDALATASSGAWAALRKAGLDGIAEAPVDSLPAAALTIVSARSAGLSVQRMTVHAPSDDLLALLRSAMDLQKAVGGFRAFAPLPRTISITTPTTGFDDVKTVALARLLLTDMPSIQVDWPLYGPKLAQVALTMGADDVDGVVAADPGTLGARRSALEEIKMNIRAAGFNPVERNGKYELLSSA